MTAALGLPDTLDDVRAAIEDVQRRLTQLRARKRTQELRLSEAEAARNSQSIGVHRYQIERAQEQIIDRQRRLRALQSRLDSLESKGAEMRIEDNGSGGWVAPAPGWKLRAFKQFSVGSKVIARGQEVGAADLAVMSNAVVLLREGIIRWMPPDAQLAPRPAPQAPQPTPAKVVDAIQECRAELRKLAAERGLPLKVAIDLLPKELHNRAQIQYANTPAMRRDGGGPNAPMVQSGQGTSAVRRIVNGFIETLIADEYRRAA
jgi:hypothetical protein